MESTPPTVTKEVYIPVDGGHIDDVGGSPLAVAGHVSQPGEVRVLVHESRGLARLQEADLL